MSKRKKITIITIFCVLSVLLTVVLFYYFGASYPYYDSLAKNEFQIPALDEGFIPQGLCFDEESNTFFVSGYMNDTIKPSRVYMITNGQTKYITLTLNGENYFGHAGGVATYGNIIYVVGEGKLNLIDKQAAILATNSSAVEMSLQLEMHNGADCVTTTSTGELWVGEFYRSGNYETHESHHIITPSGEQNMAISYCYLINENGLIDNVPSKGLSTRGLVQGLAFTETGDVILSTSYSLPSSNLFYYENPFSTVPYYVETEEKSIPIYILDSSNLKCKIEAPCMSEEICIVKDKVCILYESACAKYKLFTRRRVTQVQSLPLISF